MNHKKETIRRKQERYLKNLNKEAGLDILDIDLLRTKFCGAYKTDMMNNTKNSNFLITKNDGITYIENGNNIDDYGRQIEWSEIIY